MRKIRPSLRQGDGGRRGRMRWAVPGPFDPGAHVGVAPTKLDDLWARSVGRPLTGGLPPWRLHVVPDAAHGGDFALALVAQHALLDGRSLATLMRALMDGPAARESVRSTPPPRVGLRAAGRELMAMSAAGQALPMRPPGEPCSSVAVRELQEVHALRAHALDAGLDAATVARHTPLLCGALMRALLARSPELRALPGERMEPAGSNFAV